SFSPTPTTGDPSVPDPYKDLATTWPSSCSGSCAAGPSACWTDCPTTLSPGVYTANPDPTVSPKIAMSLSTTNAIYTLSPGIYYLQGNLSISGQHITVNATGGVTLVLGGNSAIATSNNATINITAPTTGWNAGIAIWEPISTAANALAGGNITGVIYMPNA